uniref:Reverse transcriptase domain-containing protein n=1 Tax=Strongyloides venezuelensis TaxID=75913 RepID=A0A0K0FNT3_STRVS
MRILANEEVDLVAKKSATHGDIVEFEFFEEFIGVRSASTGATGGGRRFGVEVNIIRYREEPEGLMTVRMQEIDKANMLDNLKIKLGREVSGQIFTLIDEDENITFKQVCEKLEGKYSDNLKKENKPHVEKKAVDKDEGSIKCFSCNELEHVRRDFPTIKHGEEKPEFKAVGVVDTWSPVYEPKFQMRTVINTGATLEDSPLLMMPLLLINGKNNLKVKELVDTESNISMVSSYLCKQFKVKAIRESTRVGLKFPNGRIIRRTLLVCNDKKHGLAIGTDILRAVRARIDFGVDNAKGYEGRYTQEFYGKRADGVSKVSMRCTYVNGRQFKKDKTFKENGIDFNVTEKSKGEGICEKDESFSSEVESDSCDNNYVKLKKKKTAHYPKFLKDNEIKKFNDCEAIVSHMGKNEYKIGVVKNVMFLDKKRGRKPKEVVDKLIKDSDLIKRGYLKDEHVRKLDDVTGRKVARGGYVKVFKVLIYQLMFSGRFVMPVESPIIRMHWRFLFNKYHNNNRQVLEISTSHCVNECLASSQHI